MPVAQCHFVSVNTFHRLREMEDDSMRLMQASNKGSYFRSEFLLHGYVFVRDDVHSDLPRAQRRCHFQANETGTDDNRLLR